jgi:glutamate carboxypeptidase
MQNFNFSELKRIVTINSWTKNKEGVDKNGDIFKNWLKELGYSVEVYKRESIGNHLLFKSAKKEGKKVLLLGHLDTVFPPGKFDDFKEDSKWIYGPGVCDMKGGNYVALLALRALYKELGNIFNIDFLLVSDEETGSDDSKAISSKIAKDYDYCLVFEAAGKNNEVVVGRKGVGTFFIDLKGTAAHAGNNYIDGADANLEASYKLQKLVALTNLDKGTTLNVGKISGGIGANTISPEAHLTFELRYTTISERDRVLIAIENIVNSSTIKGVTATLSGGIQRDVMQPNSNQEAFLNEVNRVCKVKLLTESRGGVSDANIIASQGVMTLDGFGPFGDGDHTINERASKDSFKKRINLTQNLLKAIINGEIDI